MTRESAPKGRQQGKARPYPWTCPACLREEVWAATMPYSIEVSHDGRSYQVEVAELHAAKCQACGEVIFSNDADDQITAALRSLLRLLTPEQIRAGRRRFDLSQKELAEHLGVA